MPIASLNSKDEAAEKDAEEVGHAAQDDGHQGDDRVAQSHPWLERRPRYQQRSAERKDTNADGEGGHSHAADVDPHQRSGFGILMHGADRAAEIGPRQQPIEEPGQHDACGKGDDQRRAHDNYIAEQ